MVEATMWIATTSCSRGWTLIRRYGTFGEYHLAPVVVAVVLSGVSSSLVNFCPVFPFACNEGSFRWRACLCLQIADIGLHAPDCPSPPPNKDN